MANQPASNAPDAAAGTSTATSLSDRAARYRDEIEKIVAQVGEHPLCEMKRACSFQSLSEKIEFVKDIQSTATSRIQNERLLVIGADEASKTLCAVQNQDEFDDATIRQILEKYLAPAPDFEVFKLISSGGLPFILIVIPKQKTRRILARVTVEDASGQKPKLLLREGDLWTKGASTGKRLATPEDWDDIYDENVEARVEHQTRQRTAHLLEAAVARAKVQSESRPALASAFTDTEFKALMEDICAAQDAARFNLLLERLRDDLVEGWYQVGGYEQSSTNLAATYSNLSTLRGRVREHINNVFRPAMHWLTLAGIYSVKNSGPSSFLDSAIDLLGEVFDTSHRLTTLNLIMPLGSTSESAEAHLSRSVPALESLVSVYLIGAYIMKRERLQYFRSLFRPDVLAVGSRVGDQEVKAPMVFWPFRKGSGEPEDLWVWGGRISFCANRIHRDPSYLALFGSEISAVEVLCQLELCLELNSYCASWGEDTEQASKYLSQILPNVDFTFWPCLISFSLENIKQLTLRLFDEITKKKLDTLRLIFVDPVLAGYWSQTGSNLAFARFIGGLAQRQSQMYFQHRRMPPSAWWPKEFQEALNASRKKTI
jgi:hypothetical protein